MAIVSVLDFGADPTGSIDSTGAFMMASKAAQGGTVQIPRGDYRIEPSATLEDNSKVLWWSAKWVGEFHRTKLEQCTRILPTKSGGRLLDVPGKGYIESLVIDCENQVECGLYVQGHACYLRDIRITNATNYGAQFIGPTLTAYGIHVSDSAKGILLQGCNGSTFIDPLASHCDGVGIEVHGGVVDPKGHGGGLTIMGAKAEICGIDGNSPLVWFRGVEGGYYQFGYLEGAADGVWLDDDTHNGTFIGTRCVIDPDHVAIRLQSARMCTFMGFSAPGDNTKANRVLVDAARSAENEFHNMSRATRSVRDTHPMAIVWEHENGDKWTAFERDSRLQSDEQPQIGRWQQGQVIENAHPATGEPQGWVCVQRGEPGAWLPLASVQ